MNGDIRDKVIQLENARKSKKFDWNNYYDVLTELLMKKVLDSKSNCIDVGCFEGTILSSMIKHAPQGKFLAFEPLPEFYKKLVESFKSPNVFIYNLALGDASGFSEYNHCLTHPMYSGLKKRSYDFDNEIDEKIWVRTETLDNVLKKSNPGKISFIKIDVEGGEYDVMKGAINCIKNDKPFIVFECGRGSTSFYGNTPGDIFKFLNDECGMYVTTLSNYLLNKNPLSEKEFCQEFDETKNFFFMSHAK